MNMSMLSRLRRKLNVMYTPIVKGTLIFVGTAFGVGMYYYPIITHIMDPPNTLSEEEKKYYDKENYYPIKVKRQREEAAKTKKQLEYVKNESS